MRRFSQFTGEELHMLERQAMEGSFDIVMSGRYDIDEIKLHERLLNEIVAEVKERNQK